MITKEAANKKIGNKRIRSKKCEKLLGIELDHEFYINGNVTSICKNASEKIIQFCI